VTAKNRHGYNGLGESAVHTDSVERGKEIENAKCDLG